jgi:hypothetical protein
MSGVTYQVRLLEPGDQQLAWDLGSRALGYRERPMPEGWASDSPGRRTATTSRHSSRQQARLDCPDHALMAARHALPSVTIYWVAA